MGVSKVWLAGPLRGTVAAAPALVTIQVPRSTFKLQKRVGGASHSLDLLLQGSRENLSVVAGHDVPVGIGRM